MKLNLSTELMKSFIEHMNQKWTSTPVHLNPANERKRKERRKKTPESIFYVLTNNIPVQLNTFRHLLISDVLECMIKKTTTTNCQPDWRSWAFDNCAFLRGFQRVESTVVAFILALSSFYSTKTILQIYSIENCVEWEIVCCNETWVPNFARMYCNCK